jgi:hypothetical protein
MERERLPPLHILLWIGHKRSEKAFSGELLGPRKAMTVRSRSSQTLWQLNHRKCLRINRCSQESRAEGLSSLQSLQTKGKRKVTRRMSRHRMGAIRCLDLQG